ncbi:response regulator transcription factor [Flavobacterium sp.]|uniref:response regulator transcription factor n=1 Tax=Flavobacterium sp. TaxID=239 RepID=UPI004034B2F6
MLRELANGHNSLEVSRILSISKHTVDSHRKNMLRKTNAGSTGEMIRMAYDKGWI